MFTIFRFVEQQEIYTLNRLLEGYDQLDSKAIYEALNSPFIKNLDNEFTKLARALQQSHAVVESKGQNQTIPENEEKEEPSML